MDNERTFPAGARPPLRRRPDDRMVAGVAAGLAAYLDVDVTLIRLGFVLAAILGGLGVPVYAACWLLVPEEGTERALADDLFGRGRI